MKITRLTALLIFLITVVGCDRNKTEQESYIKLSESDLLIDSRGDTKTIYVTSNCNWTVKDHPDWVDVDVDKEAEKPNIKLVISSNDTDFTREANISITDGVVEERLNISQESNARTQAIEWHTFPVNSITSADFILGANGIERTYNIVGDRLFINKQIKDKIYHGNLINVRFNSFDDLVDYSGYTYHPITVGSFVGGKAFIKTMTPSLQEMNELAHEIIQSLPSQNLQFYFSNSPIRYTSYRQLHLLGNGNLGIDLEKCISGHSYTEKEMNKKNGFIYSYSMVLFDLVMDNQERVIAEEITDNGILADLSYIKSVNYGRTAFLIIETDESDAVVNSMIKKVGKNESLNDNERIILNELEVYYLHFDANADIVVESGNEELIRKYMKSITDSDIIPLTFSTQSYNNHSLTSLYYSVVLR